MKYSKHEEYRTYSGCNKRDKSEKIKTHSVASKCVEFQIIAVRFSKVRGYYIRFDEETY